MCRSCAERSICKEIAHSIAQQLQKVKQEIPSCIRTYAIFVRPHKKWTKFGTFERPGFFILHFRSIIFVSFTVRLAMPRLIDSSGVHFQCIFFSEKKQSGKKQQRNGAIDMFSYRKFNKNGRWCLAWWQI